MVKAIVFVMLCGFGTSYSMELRHRKSPESLHMNKGVLNVRVNLNDSCSFCRQPFSVRKGALIFTYCKHVYHKDCYDSMVKHNGSEKCLHCRDPLVSYDPEVIDELKENDRQKEKHTSCIDKTVYCCARYQVIGLHLLVDLYNEIEALNRSAWVYS